MSVLILKFEIDAPEMNDTQRDEAADEVFAESLAAAIETFGSENVHGSLFWDADMPTLSQTHLA